MARTARSAERIKIAYLELLEKFPHEKITVTQVAQQARVNRVTFYRLFENLDDVLESILDTFDQGVSERLAYISAGAIALEEILASIMDLHRANMPMMRTILRSSKAPLLMARIEMGTAEPVDRFMFPDSMLETQHALLRSFYVAGITRLVADWILGGCTLSTAEMVELLGKTGRYFELIAGA